MITLNHYLVLSAALFCIGLFGVLTSRNAIRVVICVELILNAVNLNLAAFSAFVAPNEAVGHELRHLPHGRGGGRVRAGARGHPRRSTAPSDISAIDAHAEAEGVSR